MPETEPVAATDAQVLEWTPTARSVDASYRGFIVACLVARIEQDRAALKAQAEELETLKAGRITCACGNDTAAIRRAKCYACRNAGPWREEAQAEEIAALREKVEFLTIQVQDMNAACQELQAEAMTDITLKHLASLPGPERQARIEAFVRSAEELK